LIDYLSQFHPNTAIKQYDRIIEKINALKGFPFMYEEYPIDIMGFRYRRMVVDKYLVFYVVLENTIEIHRIINSRMDITKVIK
jgi:plasmid stabilization system protein ParE